MAETTENMVRRLLVPCDDEKRWRDGVYALRVDEAIPMLTAVLNDPAERIPTRRLSALILGMLADKRALSALLPVLDDPEPVLRAEAASSLGYFARLEPVLLERLIASLQDKDYFVRESAAKTLGRLRCQAAYADLKQMSIEDSVSTNRLIALEALKSIEEVA